MTLINNRTKLIWIIIINNNYRLIIILIWIIITIIIVIDLMFINSNRFRLSRNKIIRFKYNNSIKKIRGSNKINKSNKKNIEVNYWRNLEKIKKK
jgi:hypothetical protein